MLPPFENCPWVKSLYKYGNRSKSNECNNNKKNFYARPLISLESLHTNLYCYVHRIHGRWARVWTFSLHCPGQFSSLQTNNNSRVFTRLGFWSTCVLKGCITFIYFFPEQTFEELTTIIAILPPTSPTTFIGGFSFAVNTEKEKR